MRRRDVCFSEVDEHFGVLDDALKTADQADGAAYIEVITDPYEAPPMYKKLHEHVESFYNLHYAYFGRPGTNPLAPPIAIICICRLCRSC